jgi:hypothetical protein
MPEGAVVDKIDRPDMKVENPDRRSEGFRVEDVEGHVSRGNLAEQPEVSRQVALEDVEGHVALGSAGEQPQVVAQNDEDEDVEGHVALGRPEDPDEGPGIARSGPAQIR